MLSKLFSETLAKVYKKEINRSELVSQLFDKLFITVEVYGELSRNKSLIKSLTKILKEGNVEILGSPELATYKADILNWGLEN